MFWKIRTINKNYYPGSFSYIFEIRGTMVGTTSLKSYCTAVFLSQFISVVYVYTKLNTAAELLKKCGRRETRMAITGHRYDFIFFLNDKYSNFFSHSQKFRVTPKPRLCNPSVTCHIGWEPQSYPKPQPAITSGVRNCR